MQVILVAMVVLFAGISYKIIRNPHDVLWLEEYLDFWCAAKLSHSTRPISRALRCCFKRAFV